MLIPSFFLGKYTEVRPRTAKIVERLLAGKSFIESLPDNRIINTSTESAGLFLLLTLPDISVTSRDFHFTLLRAALSKSGDLIEDAHLDAIFAELMKKEWGPLVFANQADGWFAQSFLADYSSRRVPYLASVLHFASSYSPEGKRFVDERGNTGSFWQANSSLNWILAQSGIPAERLKEKLNEASFRAMCRKLGIV